MCKTADDLVTIIKVKQMISFKVNNKRESSSRAKQMKKRREKSLKNQEADKKCYG